jgi:hypothetical protein
MASTFSDLGIELMATGENSGTWGTKTNTNLQIVEKSIAGYVEQAVTSGGTTALTITDGDATESTSVARHAVIKLTGTISGNSIVTVPDSIEKVYIVTNGTSGAYTVQFKTASGTGITFGVSEKTTKLVYSDGTNIIDAGFGGALDIEGRELVLDADGDTTLTADTDDQIDIKIAGADDFQFTANTFTAQSGSSIVVPEGGLTFGSTAITSTAAELNLLDGVSGLVQADLTKLAAVDSTAAELNIVDGGTSATSTTVADADRVVLNDNGTMVQVAVTDLAAYFDDEITAMPNLTSVGTLTTLTVDSIIINGTNIGHTSDADAIAIASNGNVTVSQNLTVTGDITVSGDDITMGTNTAGNLLVADGTNFNSIAVGSLSEISTVANDDVFLAVDTSGGGLKKIARSAVVSGLATSGAISNVVEDTSPQLGANLDTNSHNILIDDAHFIADENGNEQIIFQTTSSAVNQFDVTNAATGNGPTISSTGGDTNIDLNLTPKGSGVVMIDGNVGIETGVIDLKNGGTASKILFYCESSNAHAQTLQSAAHSAGATNTLTLPGGSTIGNSAATLVSDIGTQTLTNKTLTTPVIAEIDSGSTITLDATTDIVLDADGGDIFFKDAGTTFGSATNTSGNLIIKSGTTTALTFSGANITAAGNLSVSGDLDVTGTLDLSDSNFTNVGSLQLDSIAGDGDTNTAITFSGSDVITVSAGGDNQVTFTNGAIVPSTDNDIDLGTSSTEFKDAFFDGTVTTDGLTVSGTPSFAAGTIALTGLDIDGGTDISADLTTSDLIIVDDGAGGTNRKAALSRVVTLVSANIDDPTALAIALG